MGKIVNKYLIHCKTNKMYKKFFTNAGTLGNHIFFDYYFGAAC